MAAKRTPPAPFGPAGKRLIDAVTAVYGLDVHEIGLLEAAAHSLDTMAELQRQIDMAGAMIPGANFESAMRVNPALAELRAQKAIYVRLLKALGLPKGIQAEKGPRRTRFEMNRQLHGLPGAV
jgi:hypothetical protein